MTVTARTRLKMWSLLVGVFVLGAVSGSALTGLYRSRASGPEARERAMHERFENMRRELNLTDEQTAAVRTIIDETRNEYRALRAELRPRFEEPRQKARTKIRALLTPDQQKKFDALVAQQDAQHDEEQKSRH
jgi:Spy/CpxP family protein refolding chaperone